MVKLRPNGQRANRAIIFLWITMGAILITIIVQLYQLTLVDELKSNPLNPSAELLSSLDSSDTLAILSAGLFGLAYLGSCIVFITWFRRAYYNLHSLTNGLKLSEGWASGAWFVPVYNLWAPFNIGQDLFKHSERLLVDSDLTKPKQSRLQTLGLWWAFWIAAMIMSSVESNMQPKEGEPATIDDFINYYYAAIIAGLLLIVAGLFAIKMIKEYREMENLLPQLSDVTGSYSDESDLLDSEF